jgi:hypothetical protein
MKRETIFVVQIMWLIFLIVSAVYFFRTLSGREVNLGSIPIGVLWFGALGAILISLTGVVEHTRDWDPDFALWHLSRPLVGASLAVVSVLMLQAGVLATGTAQPSGAQGAPKNLLYYLVSFLVGYREETFRELIKRFVDLILAPAAPKTAPSIASFSPVKGPVAGQVPLRILGSGFTGTSAVSFGSVNATFTVDSDGQISLTLPPAATVGPVGVTVKTKVGSASAPFEYT